MADNKKAKASQTKKPEAKKTNTVAPKKVEPAVETKVVEKAVKKEPVAPVVAKPVTVVKETEKPAVAKKAPVTKKEEKIEVAKKVETATKATETKPVVKNEPLKVLFVAGESAPFIKTGGLGDVAAALPQSLCEQGVDARVILPLYMDIPQEFKANMRYIGNCYVTLSWRYQYCGLFTYKYQGVQYYFVDNEYYFKRHGLYGHFDDGERFAFFSKAVLECLRLMDFYPDVIHANDWHTALVPVFLDCSYRGVSEYAHIKTVFTIHNIEFQGQYGDGIVTDVLGFNSDQAKLVEYKNCTNYMKGGIESANKVTTVSPSYAKEILDPFYGYGMQDILNLRSFKLEGIINGIDTQKNNPDTDKSLFKNYNADSLDNKVFNKIGLQELLGLPVNKDVPMIGMVGRLTHQKGIDLLTAVMDKVLSMNVQLVILGTGDWKYENMLKDMQNQYPGKLRAVINFSSDMASKIYAASDLFLMPSKFEPCGLSQMIAMRYATVPIVRETGGLKDTVEAYNHETKRGTGFTFKTYNANDMLGAIERAVGLYYDYKEDWNTVVKNGVQMDFGWDKIATKYIDMYKNL